METVIKGKLIAWHMSHKAYIAVSLIPVCSLGYYALLHAAEATLPQKIAISYKQFCHMAIYFDGYLCWVNYSSPALI